MRKLLVILLLLLPVMLPAQQVNLDSLWGVWEDESQPDTNRLKAINKIAWDGYIFKNIDSSFVIAKEQVKFAKKINNVEWEAQGLNTIAVVHQLKGDYLNALKIHQEALNLRKQCKHYWGVASSYNNMANIFSNIGNIEKSIIYYHDALKIFEKLNSPEAAQSMMNLGILYREQGEIEKSKKITEEAIKHFKLSNNQIGIAQAKINLASTIEKMGKIDEALDYLRQAEKFYKSNSTVGLLVYVYSNIANTYQNIQQYDSAYHYFDQSLELAEKIGDQKAICGSYAGKSLTMLKSSKIRECIKYGEEGLQIAKKFNLTTLTSMNAGILYDAYKINKDYRLALEMYELHVQTKDSIKNEKNTKAIIKQQIQYNYEKQAAADSVQAAETAKVKDALLTAQRAENARQQQQAYYLYGGLALALLFGGFIFNRFRVTNKQKKVIEHQKTEVEQQRELADKQRKLAEEQKEVVEEKNKEIIDSINYAKRLQEAILPPAKLVKEYLQQSFILYKPKDIVAGDFYWMETLPSRQAGVGDTVYLAAADCTGHGVPGAMVSVVCSNALSKALIEENITDVGKLLDRTRELVVERFGRSEENIQDGMDLALCALNTKTNELKYAGANNPLWIIRKGATEVEETKADKQPIGKYDKEDPFTTHSIDLQKGDTLYIFSDGYPDQFGGDKGKKYKTGAMKKFLLSIQDKDMATQRQSLNEEFESWKGELEQIDDVCVIGVNIK